MSGMHFLVLSALGLAVAFAGVAVVQMLLARGSIRSRVQWSVVFFPAAAFLVMSIAILMDVGSREVHPVREAALVVATLVLALGAAVGVRQLLRAMRDQQARDDELGFLRMRYERLFKGNEMPIVVFDRESLALVDINGSARDLFGGTSAGLLSTTFDKLGFEQDVRAELDLAEAEGRGHIELRRRTRDGGFGDLVIHLSVGEVAGALLVYGICEDVTERNATRVELQEQRQMLAHLADHDALTGLPNRRVLDVVLEHAFARGLRNVPGALLFIDVDDFKKVNDLHGHQAGDATLVAIARVLERGVRAPGDVVVRVGGDEFAILLEAIDLAEATVIAERLVVSVSECFAGLGLSVGVASVRGAVDVVEVVRRADECMYAAKAAGGGRVIVAGPKRS
jgi:diguanylate cyclase (GGDEF)-like protein/PAS domain S-box-containing protein